MITISDSDKINRCDAETAISHDNNDGEAKCSCKQGYKKIDKKVGIRGHFENRFRTQPVHRGPIKTL